MATPEKLALVRRVGLMAQTGEIYIGNRCKRNPYTHLWKTVISLYNRRWTRMDTPNVE